MWPTIPGPTFLIRISQSNNVPPLQTFDYLSSVGIITLQHFFRLQRALFPSPLFHFRQIVTFSLFSISPNVIKNSSLISTVAMVSSPKERVPDKIFCGSPCSLRVVSQNVFSLILSKYLHTCLPTITWYRKRCSNVTLFSSICVTILIVYIAFDLRFGSQYVHFDNY